MDGEEQKEHGAEGAHGDASHAKGPRSILAAGIGNPEKSRVDGSCVTYVSQGINHALQRRPMREAAAVLSPSTRHQFYVVLIALSFRVIS